MAPRVGKLRPVIYSDWLLGNFCILGIFQMAGMPDGT